MTCQRPGSRTFGAEWNHPMGNGYRIAFLALMLIQALFLARIIFLGEVIYPHCNNLELTGMADGVDCSPENRKFSDQSSAYMPEIELHLNGARHSWLTTWNPHNQLGRPAIHLSGFSRAYPIAFLLSLFITNAFVFYSIFTAITVILTGVFCFLFLKRVDFHPVTCLVLSIGLSCGVPSSYWLTFVMFLSPVCWALCLLWLITALFHKRSFVVATGLSFGVYSLLMTAYPQSVVATGYVILTYTLLLFWRSNSKTFEKLEVAGLLCAATFFGLICALPVYIDLGFTAGQSDRVNADHVFFLASLPKIHGIKDLGFFLGLCYDAFWFGNPIHRSYPFEFNGLSLTPLYFTLSLLTVPDGQWKKLWPWQAFVMICFISTVWKPAYLLLVDYAGFCFSRYLPLSAAIIPAFLLAGYGMERLIRGGTSQPRMAIISSIIPLALMAMLTIHEPGAVNPGYAFLSVATTAGIAMAISMPKIAVFMMTFLGILGVFAYGFQLQLVRPVGAIVQSSPLTEALVKESKGYRYGKIGPELAGFIPPNHEIMLGVNSPFSYDSLSSRRFQQIILGLSDKGAHTFGRWFGYIESDSKIDSDAISYSGINLLVSKTPIHSYQFSKVHETQGILFYRRNKAPAMMAQLRNFSYDGCQVLVTGSLDDQIRLNSRTEKSFDDYIHVKPESFEGETLLFLSRQYHPSWKAWNGDSPLQVVQVNDFYLGVIVAPGVTDIEMAFRPCVVWAWIPQVCFAVLGIGAALVFIRKRRLG